jgi:sugar phosphate isomerase/epimerase
MSLPLKNFAVHTITNKPWTLQQCCDAYAKAGFGGVSVWRNVVEPIGLKEAVKIVNGSGLRVPALVRGGFFPSFDDSKRQVAIEDNRKCIDEAAALGAEMVVLVVGAVPKMPLEKARQQIEEGIAICLPYAAANKVKLAIEPLHPMYAADRSAINRMAEARLLCDRLKSPWLGIALDVFHCWWDPDLHSEIKRAEKNHTLHGYHVCDWKPDMADMLNDRGLMGEGCIDVKGITADVLEAGFKGLIEVEIFSNKHWARDQHEFLGDIVRACQENV